MHKCLLLGCLLVLNSYAAYAAPLDDITTLSWPDDGWYQVQTTSNFTEVCAGGRSCVVAPGTYVVINHTTGRRSEGITVGGTPASSLTITGDTISWPNDGWYQVQKSSDFTHICAGGRFCVADPGIYIVTNHTTGQRFESIVVSDYSSAPVIVTGSVISWPNNGWYQVQTSGDYAHVCNGGRSCIVPPGKYVVTNHTTGQQFDGIVVSDASASPITVSGSTISWPDDGWYQVQTADSFIEVCAGGFSCDVPKGAYVVINHTTGARHENIVVHNGSSVLPSVINNSFLNPLPSPPLTPAPGADSETQLLLDPVTTITEFLPVRDPLRNLEDTFGDLSDEDFLAGPLPAITYTPDHVNPQKNTAPFFENLNDVEAVAGELLTIVFRPKDPDGGLAGQFSHALPDGARYIDNFDATRSLIWRPLQPAVGITEFTVTAVDAVEPFYRTERTIRIKVVLPDDPSTIQNAPPRINQLRDSTVRRGDPVVAYIKATDLNGTVPKLELVNPPAGASLTQYYADPTITILHFIPQQAKIHTLEFLARDADDPQLTVSSKVKIEVLDPEKFVRPGRRLKDLASDRQLLIGYAALSSYYQQPDGALYASIAGEEFNFVSTENSLKWDAVNPLPGKYRWAAADNLVKQAKFYQQEIMAHTLVWYAQLPPWVMRTPLTSREVHMREHIDRVVSRYVDDIQYWDVVNEAFEDDGSFRNSVWFEAMGESYIDIAFRQARQSAPNATLLFNEYDIAFNGPKAEATLALLERLKADKIPVDGLGFQLHVDADFDRFDELAAIFSRVADLDLDIYVTELDVSMQTGQTLAQQALVYERVLDACLVQPRCKGFQTWGFTDKHSWLRENTPLYFDQRYQPKPAYRALQQRLSEYP